jgi:hypothetical protein
LPQFRATFGTIGNWRTSNREQSSELWRDLAEA